eukprot:CAMPEP_0194208342 /NCGR_PEP_ID=MMETSP0156-20130528/6815_1 /TAXON_ID=33649 /ORGANISM="Thalassionema nitzschioides, Strain L26-B" /LENGTH=200 /DNA_ID=CAMNT_0038935287 /DNA_START=140 /DNA_END=742 /DNA_ORIENTATION=-
MATAACLSTTTTAFTINTASKTTKTTTQLQMGLFDGVKDAFSAPPSNLDAERETPIDRWMGWSVAKEDVPTEAQAQDANFVDAMDDTNYITVALEKPMGVIFEENDQEVGGIFIQSFTEDGAAAKSGLLKEGDQLVAVDGTKVSGLSFDDSLGTIVNCDKSPTPLLLFRGTKEQLYGPTGASQEWLDEFVSKTMTEAATS